MNRFASVFLAGFFLSHTADAQDAARTREAMNNMQADLSVCLAYFSIFKECSAGETKNLRLAQLAIDNLTIKSETAADALGMTKADVATRLELNLASQRHLVGSCAGMSILLSRYAEDCNGLVLDADPTSMKYLPK